MQIVSYDCIRHLLGEKEEKKASDILITVSLSDSPNPASHCHLNFNNEGNPGQPPIQMTDREVGGRRPEEE